MFQNLNRPILVPTVEPLLKGGAAVAFRRLVPNAMERLERKLAVATWAMLAPEKRNDNCAAAARKPSKPIVHYVVWYATKPTFGLSRSSRPGTSEELDIL